MANHSINIVAVGGGTGTATVLSGLKNYPHQNINALITVTDNGGSTGRLRDEFGFQPVGDLRQALAAFADTDADYQNHWINKLLLYRFNGDNSLQGHNLGNLILTSLQDMTGSTEAALEIAGKIFRLKGKVIPVSNDVLNLKITYENGEVVVGESHLDSSHGGEKIINLELDKTTSISDSAKSALKLANYIIIGPGDLYGSLLANLIVPGFSQAVSESKAKLIYISNLMTHYTQTHGLSAKDHLLVIEKYLPRPVDYVLVNNQPISTPILDKYAEDQEYPVTDDLTNTSTTRIIRDNLIRSVIVASQSDDKIKRSYLRHDPEKLAKLIYSLTN